ncbi:hypothetical protein WR25_13700 [Diploscapter pachys]|uniref:SSD domain-containing protein n=1 Tax=Diploscapter pachys TaxID=2018661 RepID=A0A2A2KU69_9BILA|nr:hypothetical protein WR25_13700 [Diploscapter pachys]
MGEPGDEGPQGDTGSVGMPDGAPGPSGDEGLPGDDAQYCPCPSRNANADIGGGQGNYGNSQGSYLQMPYTGIGSSDALSTPLYSTTNSSSAAPIRIQRKSASIPPPGPPDPPPLTDTSESESEHHNDSDLAKLKSASDFADDRERRLKERIEKERRELEEQRKEANDRKTEPSAPRFPEQSVGSTTVEISSTTGSSGGHTKLNERGSYVEEPPSSATTLERVKSLKEPDDKETALVRRIHNDLHMAHYVQKFEVASPPQIVSDQSCGVYQIRSLRFAEAGLRRALWYMGKSIANHSMLYALIPLMLLCLAFISPLLYRSNIYMSSPFPYLLDLSRSDKISNGIGLIKAAGNSDFNYSNPAFDRVDFRDPNTFAVLLKADSSKDNILRRDAVLAYTALKKKLDHYPNGEKQFLSRCSAECEIERDMVDRVIKKSSQVALTFPETFVSLNRESTNLSKIYLGSTIGGVDIDSDGAISRAQALLMKFRLSQDLDGENLTLWLRNFRDQISTTSAPNVTMYVWSLEAFVFSVIESLWQMHYMLLGSIAIVFLFCFFTSFGIVMGVFAPNQHMQNSYPIVFVCTIYMIFAIWGCTNMKIDLKEEDFVPKNSPSSKFKQFYDEMFGKTTQFMEITIENVVDYHDHSVRTAIFEMLEKAVNDGYATRFVSWLNEFMKFEKNSIYDVNPDTFVPVVNLVFLSSESYRRFASDVVFDRYQTQVVKSRMYLDLTQKGIDHRTTLVENLLQYAKDNHIPMSVTIPSSYSLRHDMTILSNGLLVLSICLVGLFLGSLLLIGQPALSFLLLFTSVSTLVETIGYAVHWNVAMNIVTLTMAIACNALTSVVVIAFCYTYSLSGKNQPKISMRIQYAFQASFLPTLFACVLPVVSYIPLLLITVPIVVDIWKILLLSSVACLLHYLFFMPNMMQLLSEQFAVGCCSSPSCTDCCCDVDDESSIYYIPTTSRAIHPEEIYAHASYTYSVPKSITVPPSYLAIAGPPSIATSFIADYGNHPGIGDKSGRQTRRSGRHSESSVAPSESHTPRRQKRHSRHRRNHHSNHGKDDSIYEAPPSPKPTHHSESPQRFRRHASDQNASNRQNQSGSRNDNMPNQSPRVWGGGMFYGDMNPNDIRHNQQPPMWPPYMVYTPGMASRMPYSSRR